MRTYHWIQQSHLLDGIGPPSSPFFDAKSKFPADGGVLPDYAVLTYFTGGDADAVIMRKSD